MKIRGVLIEDTFAEAFAMRGGARHHHGRNGGGRARRRSSSPASPRRSSAASAKRRSSASWRRRDARRPAGRQHPALHDGHGRSRQAADRAHRPDGAHLPDDRLLRRAARRARPRRRRPALRFFGDGFQVSKVDRRPALLARAGDGRRVPGPGDVRHREGRRRRQLPDPRPERRRRARGRRGGGGRDGGCRASSCRSPAASCGAAARSARADTRA